MFKDGIDGEKIRRFFLGEHSESDKDYTAEVFCDNEREEELIKHLRRQWDELVSEKGIEGKKLDHILHRLHYEINTKYEKPKEALVSIMKWFSRVAAMLILPLMVYSGIQFFKNINKPDDPWVKIKAPAWTRAQFSLPDGTTGWLNSNSSIEYKGSFVNNRVVLLDGEAYFNVVDSGLKHFIVNTGEITVTVSGTRFNVASYANENNVEVVLETGKIECTNKELDKTFKLKPNNLISFNKVNNEYLVEVVETEKYVSWKDGKLIFRNDPLDVVARKLERWYNITVEVNGGISSQPRLRGTFVDENLEQVLRLLKLSLNITYDIYPPQILSDGSYSKTKVIITSKNN